MDRMSALNSMHEKLKKQAFIRAAQNPGRSPKPHLRHNCPQPSHSALPESVAEQGMTALDYIAISLFLLLWSGFTWLTGGKAKLKRPSLTVLMGGHRRAWLRNSLTRDLKMIDTQIISGLQNGTAFFASTSIFALGSCFPLLGAADSVKSIYATLPPSFQAGQAAFEFKVVGLAAIFAYSFFKFGWSYRLFNYCSILFGAVPMPRHAQEAQAETEKAIERVIELNILAGKHFNAGLRGIFLSIGYIGWFVSPLLLMATTLFVIGVLTRRQFFSEARKALL